MNTHISFVIKPGNKLKHEIRPYTTGPEYKQDFHKSLRMVILESEKVGKLYTEKTTGFLNFKVHLN